MQNSAYFLPKPNLPRQNGFRCRRDLQAAKELPNSTHKKSHR